MPFVVFPDTCSTFKPSFSTFKRRKTQEKFARSGLILFLDGNDQTCVYFDENTSFWSDLLTTGTLVRVPSIQSTRNMVNINVVEGNTGCYPNSIIESQTDRP